MGLSVSHNCWSGAYSSFNRFRYDLAAQIGISLEEYIGYGDNGTKSLLDIDHNLRPLFNHSDCEGILTVPECKMIALGLTQILDDFNDSLKSDYKFKEKIVQFRDGCMEAVENNQIVEFH